MSFGGGSIVMVNDVESNIGIFDTDEKLYGNEIRIKAGYEGDEYEDLVLLFVGYIKDYTTTTSTMTIEVADKRERGQVETPTEVFADLTGIAEDTNGEIIPDGYGDVIQVPAYPIKTGVARGELIFDGVSDAVSLGHDASLKTANFTLSALIYTKSTANQCIISTYWTGNWYLELVSNKFDFCVKHTSTQTNLYSTTNFSINTWYLITATFDGTTMKLYINGVLNNSVSASAMVNYASNDILIGVLGNVGRYFNGTIKDVRYYDSAIDASEVLSIYEGGSVTTDLVSQWLLDEGTGTTASDSVGSNTGTITGATWVALAGIIFRWATLCTSIYQVYTIKDEILTSVSHNNFNAGGTFTLADADAYKDGVTTKGLLKVFVTGRMRDYDNPADIIADLNDRVMGVPYNTSNYDTTEWEAESADLADISLYMDNSQKVYEWISTIQSGTNFGFRYEDRDKITLRLDNPDRTAITFSDGTSNIDPIDIRNSDMPIKQNAELYATSCTVKYSHNVRKDTYSQVSNTDY